MTDGEQSNPLRGKGVESWAFGALLATVGSVVFSIVLGQLMAGICFLCFAVALIRGKVKWRMPLLVWLGVVFVGVAVAGSLWMGGWAGLWGRTGKLMWFLLLPVTFSLVQTPRRAMQMVWAFLAGGMILAIKDLVMHPIRAARDPLPTFMAALVDKGSMTDGQMLMLGVVSATAIVLVFMRNGRSVPGWLWLMLVVPMAGLLINFKRGSWLCAVLLVGVMLAGHLRWRGWLVAAVVMVGVVALPPVHHRLGGLGQEFTRADGRLAMWTQVAPRLVSEHPMGVGYGRLTNEMMKQVWPRIESNRNHLHANWAQVLVETGWAGLGLYLAWMVCGLIQAVRATRVACEGSALGRVVAPVVLLMLAGLFLNGLVEYNFGDTELMFVYAVVMGMAGGRGEGC
jgi:O-antigen ligase